MSAPHPKLLFAVASAVVAGAIITGIAALGSPRAHRQMRLDAIRINNLQSIEQLVLSYTRLHRRLPESLEILAHEPGYVPPLKDPESGAPYVYTPTSRDTFRVCATFDTSSYDRKGIGAPLDAGTWGHHRGEQCFVRHAEVIH
jgi:hypothetical protein